MKEMTTDQKNKFYYHLNALMDLMGWKVALDKQPDDAFVPGVILGTEDFLDRIELACDAWHKRKVK